MLRQSPLLACTFSHRKFFIVAAAATFLYETFSPRRHPTALVALAP